MTRIELAVLACILAVVGIAGFMTLNLALARPRAVRVEVVDRHYVPPGFARPESLRLVVREPGGESWVRRASPEEYAAAVPGEELDLMIRYARFTGERLP